MKQLLKLILCLTLPLLIGGVSGIATSSNINTWFVYLSKPFFNPPSYLFTPVWATLYLLMGYSLYRILNQPHSLYRKQAVTAFSVQLFLNFSWSFLFFQFHLLGLALCEIFLLLASIIWMVGAFYKIDKKAAYVNIPYIMWVSFASILNGSFWWLNR